MKRIIAATVLTMGLILAPTPAFGDNIDHGPFHGSTLSVACFVDSGEYPNDRSTARWACWRVVNLKYVDTAGFKTVFRGKLGRLYGVSWGARDDLTYDGQSRKAVSSRLKYEPTFFCHGSPARRTWSCFRDRGADTRPLRWEKDELPKTCNDLTTHYVVGRADNPRGAVRSTCR